MWALHLWTQPTENGKYLKTMNPSWSGFTSCHHPLNMTPDDCIAFYYIRSVSYFSVALVGYPDQGNL